MIFVSILMQMHIIWIKYGIKHSVQKERRIIMPEYKLGEVEMKFADIIWENGPLRQGSL